MRQATAFPDRAQRLDDIAAHMDVRENYPLLKTARLDPAAYKRLRNAVNLYLYTCLDNFYGDQSFDLNENLFDTCAEAITGLPNITPNGLVLPKKPTYLAYNLIHATVADIFSGLGLQAHIQSIHAPINIRLVNGTPNPAIDGRPRASAKMHSDMWAGEPANAVMVFLPVFGEYGKIGVKWIEPRHFPSDLMRPLEDFDEGKHLIDGGREYDAAFNPGDIVLADPYLIHATQKNAQGLRLSIDFRFLTAQSLESDAPAPGTRNRNYLDYDAWADIGNGRILTTEAPLAPFDGEDVATSNEYAAPFEIKALDD